MEFELQGVAPYCQWNMSYKEYSRNTIVHKHELQGIETLLTMEHVL